MTRKSIRNSSQPQARFTGGSLKRKIRIYTFILLIAPILAFTALSFQKTTQLIQQQSLQAMDQNFSSGSEEIQRFFSSLQVTAENVLRSQGIYQFSDPSAENVISQKTLYADVQSIFSYLEQVSEADRIRLYTDQKKLYVENENTVLPFSVISGSPWFSEMIQQNESRRFLSPSLSGYETDYFSYVSILYSMSGLTIPAGLLSVDLSSQKVAEILESFLFTDNSFACISENDTVILAVGSAEGFPCRPGQAAPTLHSPKNADNASLWLLGQYGGSLYYFRRTPISQSPYILSVYVPVNEIFKEHHILYSELLVCSLFLGIACWLIADMLVSSLLRRIFLLHRETRKVMSGNFDIDLTPQGNDEISALMTSFLSMTEQLKIMIAKQYDMGIAVKNAEYEALQAQINPHFLYNTLNLINCTAIRRGVPEISDIVNMLVDYYRSSLANGNDIVSIAQEIHHASTYIKIQNMRFEKKTSFRFEYQDWMESYAIPKIILQPLVENSILHGILESERDCGLIELKSQFCENEIILDLTDNGIGMTEEKIAELLDFHGTAANTHYGIRNINERLRLLFGSGYCLQYRSTLHEGTTVTLRLPAVRMEEDTA
ncbi:sensor histidine kinase [Lachnoclostridium sp. Marseille-P6806]|uniref:sensor histidine kinase n=1 Tax=Lachnoclostridium sp. Marseille-P6806 TaxID=2364793 RepID=UPI0013EF5240|nr:histidine kinase [Lachnoclostridium sp. Marseille-P6806]